MAMFIYAVYAPKERGGKLHTNIRLRTPGFFIMSTLHINTNENISDASNNGLRII